MKRLLLSLSVACGLALGSCQKDLDQAPISNGSVPAFYASATDFNQAMTAVYSALRGYPDRTLFMSEIRSDNFYAASSQGVRDWDGINNFSTTLSINPYIADTWASDYAAIFRANTMLDQLAANGAVAGAALRTRYEGEAKFIRALMYFDLVRYFGKVPLIDHALIPQEVGQIPRTDVSKVYELIIADLQTAITTLPATYATVDVGRATKGAAQGLLALVYLTRSGPTYGINGPGLATNEYDKASALLDQVIASKTYSLQSTYPRVFAFNNENNAEVVFDIQYLSGTVGGSYNGTLDTPAYFPFLGLTFAANGVENKQVSADVISSYATGDARLAFNVLQTFTYQNILYNSPLLKKYIDVTARGASYSDWGLNFIVMRYADILTMKAECILHGAGGSPADALALVNPLRTRAGLGALTTLDLATLLAERRREFLGEGLRWHDLVRAGTVLTTLNAWIVKEDAANKIARNIGANMIIYPVPQIELAAAPGVYDQNPGY